MNLSSRRSSEGKIRFGSLLEHRLEFEWPGDTRDLPLRMEVDDRAGLIEIRFVIGAKENLGGRSDLRPQQSQEI